MKAKPQEQDQIPLRGTGKILKPAATGKEREDALRTMREIAGRASQRAKELGLTEEDIRKLIYEP
jgi:predicted transcriptional regulator